MNATIIHDTLVAIFMSDNPAEVQQRLSLAPGSIGRRVGNAEKQVGPLVGRLLNGRRRFRILSPLALTYVRETVIGNDLYPGPRLIADLEGVNDAS